MLSQIAETTCRRETPPRGLDEVSQLGRQSRAPSLPSAPPSLVSFSGR